MLNFKKVLPLIFAMVLLFVMAPGVYAANDEGVTYEAILDQPTITVSDADVTVVMTVTMNKTVALDGVGGKVLVEGDIIAESMEHPNEMFIYDFNEKNNKFTSETDDAENIDTNVIAIVTFTVPANTPAGVYELGLDCNDITRDYGETWDDGAVITATLTIKESAPACEHTETKLVSNGNLTHKVVCANEECKYVLNEEEQCVATNDGDCTTDDKCKCGYVITSARDAHVPAEDDGDCTTLVKCVYCDYVVTEAQAHAFNNKPSDISNGYGADCDNAAQYYVQCDNCNVVNFEKTVEVGDPRGHGKINGFRLDPNSDGTHNVVCNDCSEATEENVKCTVDDTKTWYGEASPAQCCVAGDAYKYTSCECGYGFAAEEVKGYYPATKEHILNKIEKVPNCKDAGYSAYWECTVMYYHFSDEAGTQRIDDLSAWINVGGAGYLAPDPENHTGVIVYTYDDDTHSSYYDCCETPVVTDEPHDVNPDTHECVCGFVEHVCEHSEYETTETTHQSICECGAPVGDAEPHDFNNDAHTCVCGAVEKHVITLNANGGKFPNDAPEYLIGSIYGDSFNAYQVPARDGYNFIGWNTKADGSGDPFDPAEYRFTEDVTVYAQWEAAHSCTHDHYDIAEGTHQSICSCGKSIGDVEDHNFIEGKCSVCEYECKHGGQMGAIPEECKSNGDGTHTWYVLCDCGVIYAESTNNCSGGTATCTALAVCAECEATYGKLADHSFQNNLRGTQIDFGSCITPATYASKCDNCDFEDAERIIEGELNFNNHIGVLVYTDNGDGTHSAVQICHNIPYVTNEPHDYTSGAEKDHCVCGATKAPEHICTPDHYEFNSEHHYSVCSCGLMASDPEPHNYINYACFCGAKFTGWDGDYYYVEAVLQKTGWTEIEDSWYYLDTETGKRAEGWTRVPYPEFAIEGNTYAPNQEDIDYAASNGIAFIDATEAWFLFDDDYGIFAYNLTGVLTIGENMSYVVNGMIPWHPGYIEIDPENNDFCYFVGDTENGGNKTAEGLLYATRGIEPGKYYFINWGRVDEIVGVQDIDGVLYYFDADHKIAMGAGLIKIEEGKYIYVRSNGMLAQNQYYIPMGLELASGMYQIDSNGFIIDPVSSDKNGIHDGYYYENGKLVYAGLIEIDGAIYYIKSNGQVATGEYYVTKISAELADTYSAGDKLIFGEDGKMESVKNGIVFEDGNYYFYENNHIMYGAGVIEIEEGVYIYVRSNGQLATGEYWPAKTNGLLEIGKYDWGTDGKYYAD